ncbi:MAG TPA: Hsp20/alpha crystallin family protein [Bacteroidota bacterium]|nr:Hsp20/alpha crystallin family protein [Bacteroidota bacterium]
MLISFESRPAMIPLIDEVLSFDREFGELFGQSFAPAAFRENVSMPRMDVTEGKDNVVVSVELPGISKEDVKIDLENDLLSISGNRNEKGQQGGTKQIARERWTGKFSRTIRLPYDVERSAVSAELSDGLLTVVLPKAESAKPREIAVR